MTRKEKILIGSRDKQINILENEIKKRNELLLLKTKELENDKANNKYLEDVSKEYKKYYDIVVNEKQLQHSSMMVLKEYLDDITKLKTDKINYHKVNIKPANVVNHKIEFFNKIQGIKKLLEFSDKTKADYELLISKLQDQRFELNTPPMMYTKINDVVNGLLNNDLHGFADRTKALSRSRRSLFSATVRKNNRGFQK